MKPGSFTTWLRFPAIRTLMAVLVFGVTSAIAADLLRPPAGLTAPPKPTAMPAFDLPTTAGSTFRSESLRGQVVVVRYWASW